MEQFESLDLAPGMFGAAGTPSLTATIGRLLPDGSIIPVKVDYVVIDGKAVHEGDIVLGNAETVAAREALRADDHQLALVRLRAGGTWPGGIVPIESDAASTRLVAATIAYVQSVTPFRFVPRAGQGDYVRVQAGAGSDSRIGRQGGVQVVSVAPQATIGTLAHEFCHVLGLWHEQCRSDRDAHVNVIAANILPGYAGQFAVQRSGVAPVGSYDLGSLMHYPSDAFAMPGTRTITRKDGSSLPPRSGLSAGDIAGLRSLYPSVFV